MSVFETTNTKIKTSPKKDSTQKKISFVKATKKKRKLIVKEKVSDLTVAETFVGCGGSHIAFKDNNFKTVFCNDIWKDSLDTLTENNPELDKKQVIHDDIKNLVNMDLLKMYNIKKGELSVLMGGVVCKGFSLAGVRNPFDDRNYLYISQLRLVEQLMPKVSVIENVPGMQTMKILKKQGYGPISKKWGEIKVDETIDNLCKQLNDTIESMKQNRGKTIAINKKLLENPSNSDELKKQHSDLTEEKNELTEIRDSYNKQLEKYKYGVLDDIVSRYEELGYRTEIKKLTCSDFGGYTKRQRLIIVAIRNDIKKEWQWPEITHSNNDDNLENLLTVRDAFDTLDLNDSNHPENDPDNVPMNHKPSTVEKFKLVGKNKKKETFFSRGTSSRLSYDQPAPTLVPGHSSFQIHPEEHRSITVREGATITGFPTNYKFSGNHSSRCMQIGNAIPYHLGNVIAKSVKKFLTD